MDCWLQRITSLHLIPNTANHLWRQQKIWQSHFFRLGWYHLSQRRAWTQVMEDLLPCWKPYVFSLHCHRVSREVAAHQPRCWSRCSPAALFFHCIRKSSHFWQLQQVVWAPRNHSLGLRVSSAAEGTGRKPMTELAIIQGQQATLSTSPSGYQLCPFPGLGPGKGNLLTVPLIG